MDDLDQAQPPPAPLVPAPAASPAPPPDPTEAQAVDVLLRNRSVLTLVGGALAVLGAFLPWMSFVWASPSGLEGDGVYTMIGGGIAFAVAVAGTLRPWGRTLCLLLGIAITAVAVFYISNLNTMAAEIAADPDNAFGVKLHVGPGLYATAGGGVGILFGGLLGH